jgi:hypothetical protein
LCSRRIVENAGVRRIPFEGYEMSPENRPLQDSGTVRSPELRAEIQSSGFGRIGRFPPRARFGNGRRRGERGNPPL